MKKIMYIGSKFLLGFLLVFGGIAHFTKTEFYLRAMPSYLPFHELIVYASGMLEILLGILLIISKNTRKTALAIIILLIAIFPANINMYINHTDFPDMSETALLIRLPIQLLLIAWTYIFIKET